MTVLVIVLFVVKEQFPFSNFPMYSHLDTEAYVVFIADQKGTPLSMDDVFRSGSSTAKKVYEKEVVKLTKPNKRDSKEATPEERRIAGGIILDDWSAKMKREALPSGTTALRLYRRMFAIAPDGHLADQTPELLAEKPL